MLGFAINAVSLLICVALFFRVGWSLYCVCKDDSDFIITNSEEGGLLIGGAVSFLFFGGIIIIIEIMKMILSFPF